MPSKGRGDGRRIPWRGGALLAFVRVVTLGGLAWRTSLARRGNVPAWLWPVGRSQPRLAYVRQLRIVSGARARTKCQNWEATWTDQHGVASDRAYWVASHARGGRARWARMLGLVTGRARVHARRRRGAHA